MYTYTISTHAAAEAICKEVRMSYTFKGYRRKNGGVGSRNLVAVIPSVICANDVAQAIVRQVQGTIGYFHHQGCCQLPLDLKRVTDVLSNL